MLNRSQVQIVVVDDGSTDSMIHIARDLREAGLVDDVLHVAMRGGKSAGVNLGLTMCRGEIVVILDIDTTLDRDALEMLVPYFCRSARRRRRRGSRRAQWRRRAWSRVHQQIEYLISISLAGASAICWASVDRLRRVRRVPSLRGPGRWRPGREVGEDADLTMKLRRAGWRIRFAPDARALTSVPETMQADRAAAALGSRRRDDLAAQVPRRFQPAGEHLPSARHAGAGRCAAVPDRSLTLLFPVYVLWLWSDLGAFTARCSLRPDPATLCWPCWLWLAAGQSRQPTVRAVAAAGLSAIYIVVQIWACCAPVRLIAILQELLLRSSYRDPYVPPG